MFLLSGLLGCVDTNDDTGFTIVLEAQDTGSLEASGVDSAADSDTPQDEPDNPQLAIEGDWEDVFGDFHSITQQTWTNPTGTFHVVEFDNDVGWVITRNDDQNSFNAGKYSKFEWLEDSQGQSFFCQSVFESVTEEGTMDTSANRDDLEIGCRGMGWKRYRAAMPIRGAYIDGFSIPHTINAFRWNWGAYVYHVVEFPYEDHLVVVRNDQNNPDGANQWSQLAWVEESRNIWVCKVGTSETIESVRDLSSERDNLLSGCNGQEWTQLVP